jgi:hypothetical protein
VAIIPLATPSVFSSEEISRKESRFYSEFFYIRHWSSHKYVHPKGGCSNPETDTQLVLFADKNPDCMFKVVEYENAGEYFLLQHVNGKVCTVERYTTRYSYYY